MSEENINLTENDIWVLGACFDKNTGMGLSKSKSLSIDELKDRVDIIFNEKGFENISISKVRNAITKLISKGYIDLGIKKGLKNTYHVTPEGINYIMEIKQTVININKKEGK